METRCSRTKLKDGSLERVRQWAAELRRRRDEVVATLRDEGTLVESVFLERTREGDYLIYYMKAKNLARAEEAYRRSTHEIDAYHLKFKEETWESRANLELLVDFDLIEEER